MSQPSGRVTSDRLRISSSANESTSSTSAAGELEWMNAAKSAAVSAAAITASV